MGNFKDNRLVNFDDLEKAVDKEGKRIYSERLLQKIKSGNLNCLNEIDLVDRNNKYYMEPLLFAVKNSEFSTYEVFKYYGEELQKNDLTIATEIVVNEPEVMENTVITDNPTLVLYFAKVNPEIILYISDDLKNDGEFIEELCETGNKEAISYAIRECNIAEAIQDNPELANNIDFMKEAIKEDASLLKHVDVSLKNNYEFIKEVSKENKEVINYVAEHTEDFGKDALNGARESLGEHFVVNTTKEVQKERKQLQVKKAELKLEGKENAEEAKKIEKRERDLNSVDRALARFESMPPEKKPRYAHLILQSTKMNQYQNMDQHYVNELEKYERIYIAEKEKAAKVKVETQEKEENGYIIGHDAIVNVVGDSTPSKMNKQFEIMEDTLNIEKTNESMEVTNDNRWSKGERQ